jgi:peptidoglycan/LPS O-acetylase OafA/YrhL
MDHSEISRSVPAGETRDRSGYMPQLDGLRALAILAVLFDHWTNGLMEKVLPLGLLGVRLFFVLSGFLITGILLRSRDTAESGAHTKALGLWHFYIRRALRIFPIYYLTVAVTALLYPSIRSGLAWHLTYTSNFYNARIGGWPLYVGHYWSLAVEEQFYFVWPWLILFTPRRVLPVLVMLIICIAPVFRLIAGLEHVNDVALIVLTPSALDSLGLGALLALCDTKPSMQRIKRRWAIPIFWAAAGGMIAMLVLQKFGIGYVARKALWYAIASVLFACAVDLGARGMGGVMGRFLENEAMRWIGKVSYGIYLYHVLLISVIDDATASWAIRPFVLVLVQLVMKAAATFAVAAISWRLIEKPLNDLKRYFTY